MAVARQRNRRRFGRRREGILMPSGELNPLVRLWVLRLLVGLPAGRLLDADGIRDERLAAAIGLECANGSGLDDDTGFGREDARAVRRNLRELHRRAERESGALRPPRVLERNVGRLAELVNLNAVETRILVFAVLLHQDAVLEGATDLLGALSGNQVSRVLSTILDLPEAAVRAAVHGEGVLFRSGLLSLDYGSSLPLLAKLDLLSPDFAERLLDIEADPISFIRDTVVPASAPQLGLRDYPHLAAELKLLLPWLRNAVRTRRPGVNLLFHGCPGTGKSQLARVLAKATGCDLFEVSAEDADGDPTNGDRRLRSLRAGQCFFASRKALLLFDEVEDVFEGDTGLFGLHRRSSSHKAWINRMLESNPVPVIWIANTVGCLDPAFIRRFDMVVELPVPPRAQRRRVLADACGDLLPAEALDRIAGSAHLAPAIAARAAKVLRATRRSIPAGGVVPAFELLVNGTLRAQGHPPLRPARPDPGAGLYDLGYLNADADLAAVAAGLLREKAGRICLHGPPGTGKTAWGHWLAGQLDRPLHVKRGSDLLSPWVGGSEENIAAAFLEAEQQGAILLIDEIDGFLRERGGAKAGWEVTQVNEMLTRMEDFPGLFIASTNLVEGIDQAALRRFDLKVRLDYLQAGQAWSLFRRHCVMLRCGPPPRRLRDRLGRLENLTPGDFAAALRRSRFEPPASPEVLLERLEADVALKAASGARIGFV